MECSPKAIRLFFGFPVLYHICQYYNGDVRPFPDTHLFHPERKQVPAVGAVVALPAAKLLRLFCRAASPLS